jgi:hypothetical protein
MPGNRVSDLYSQMSIRWPEPGAINAVGQVAECMLIVVSMVMHSIYDKQSNTVTDSVARGGPGGGFRSAQYSTQSSTHCCRVVVAVTMECGRFRQVPKTGFGFRVLPTTKPHSSLHFCFSSLSSLFLSSESSIVVPLPQLSTVFNDISIPLCLFAFSFPSSLLLFFRNV